METSSVHSMIDAGSLTYEQYSTFRVSGRLYGIDVKEVQEIVRPLPMTVIPLAQDYVEGLINLRGQVATAISLHNLFGLKSENSEPLMNVICKLDGHLISLLVDEIGDVMEVDNSSFESTPNTIPTSVRRFMKGVHKVDSDLLSILDITSIGQVLNSGEV